MPLGNITGQVDAAYQQWKNVRKTDQLSKTHRSNSFSLRREVDQADSSVILHSIIPDGFAIIDHDVFEGKKIVATKPFQEGDCMYIGTAFMLDLSGTNSQFKLRVYTPDGEGNRLLGEFDNSSTHSVDDHAPDSKDGTVSKRQVYGWDGFMVRTCTCTGRGNIHIRGLCCNSNCLF